MRLYTYKEPYVGDRRTITKFAWFPTEVEVRNAKSIQEVRTIIWLQKYNVDQRFYDNVRGSTKSKAWIGYHGWIEE